MRPAHHVHYAFDPAGRRERITGCSHAADPAEVWQFKRFSEWDAANRLTAVVQKTGAQKRNETTCNYQWQRTTRTINSGGTVESQQGWAGRGWTCLGEYRIVSGARTLERALTWGPDLSGSLTGAGGVGGLYVFEEMTGTTTGVPAGTYYPLYDGNGNICECEIKEGHSVFRIN